MKPLTRSKLNSLRGPFLDLACHKLSLSKRMRQNAKAMGLGDAFELRRRNKAKARAAEKARRASRARNR